MGPWGGKEVGTETAARVDRSADACDMGTELRTRMR